MDEKTIARFWSKVDKSGECWLWTACQKDTGYGQFRVNGHTRMVHKLSWELHRGPVPGGLSVLHDCPGGDNPACVNPAHLWLGTQADNMRDMDAKKRRKWGEHKGASNPAALLTEDQVRAVRKSFIPRKVTAKTLATRYGVTLACVWDILHRRSWTHI